mmetsp:Transcript_3831/g.10569  ORF Transcript_3831/g.10569 Transcript_3831/m.10569 type:complete len:291 (+) Transcript_3831:216-1088(+)
MKHSLQRDDSLSISFLAWSPDDRKLLSCGSGNSVRMWDTTSGAVLRDFFVHTNSVSACAWFPDGKRFVSGGLDKVVYMVDVEGDNEERRMWRTGRVNDLALTSDGKKLIVANTDKKILIIEVDDKDGAEDLEQGGCECIQETEQFTSLFLADDDDHVIINVSALSDNPSEIHMWNLSTKKLIHRYIGHSQRRFVLRSCLGGAGQSFVLGGSEDGNVYIWKRSTGKLLEVLQGHGSLVNCVAWCPTNARLIASASDDHTIRLWGTGGEGDEDGGDGCFDPGDQRIRSLLSL